MRTPRYYGHSATADRNKPPSETHKEMTDMNSRCYGKKKNVQINIYAGKPASKETVRTDVTVTAGRTKNKHGKVENGNKT